jgi:hypothetical protein
MLAEAEMWVVLLGLFTSATPDQRGILVLAGAHQADGVALQSDHFGLDPSLGAQALQSHLRPWPKPTALALPVSIHVESPVSPALLVRAPVSLNAK